MSSNVFDVEIVKRILKKNTFRPLNDSVIVYRIKLDQTAGGILLPEVQDHKASRGYGTVAVVVAIGPGRYVDLTGQRQPIDLEVGDMVIFSAQAGLELGEIIRKEIGTEVSFEEIRLLRAHDIIASLNNKNILKD